MGVRLIKPNTRSLTGNHTSLKTGKVVGFESSLELDFAFCLDIDPNVVWFESQPLRIENPERRERHYTPDFLVHYGPGGRVGGRASHALRDQISRRPA